MPWIPNTKKAIAVHDAHDLRIEEHEVRGSGSGEVQIEMAAGGVFGSAANTRGFGLAYTRLR